MIHTLKTDESANVKIAAAKSLEKYMGLESVRIAVIQELENAENVYLQIKLIKLLKRAKVKESLPVLDRMIQTGDGYLKKEAYEGKNGITNIY